MQFQIPSKYANPVCEECHNTNHEKYTLCTHPCSHLVSWTIHLNNAELVILMRKPFQTEEEQCSEAWRRINKQGLWEE